MYILEWKGGPNCEVTLLAEAALLRSTALLYSPTSPTRSPYDASGGADYVRVKFYNRGSLL
nr:hypothetical protein [uncultured Campylobacter sp.]